MRIGEIQSAEVPKNSIEESGDKKPGTLPDPPSIETSFQPRDASVDPGRARAIAYQIKAKFPPAKATPANAQKPESGGSPQGASPQVGSGAGTALDLSGVRIDPETKTGHIFYEFDTFMVIELPHGERLPGLIFQDKFIHHDPVEVVDYGRYVFDPKTGQWAADLDRPGSSRPSETGSVGAPSADFEGSPAYDIVMNLSRMSWEAEKHAGSNPGGYYCDRAGQVWLVKGSHDDSHKAARARNEVLAAELMRAVGVPVPELRLIDLGRAHGGGLGVASKLVENLSGISRADKAAFDKLRSQFAVHAWLANHDVIGMNYDNVMWAGSQIMAVDVGGALLFRAQGLPKVSDAGRPGLLDDWASEFKTMRSGNAQQQTVFGDPRHRTQLAKSAEALKNISDDQIRQIVNCIGPGDQGFKDRLVENLLNRKQSVLQQAAAELAGAAGTTRSPSPFSGAAGKFEPLPTATPERLQNNKRVGYFLHLGRVDLEHPTLAVTTRKANAWAEKFSDWYRHASDTMWGVEWETLQILEVYTRFHGKSAQEINAALRAGNQDAALFETGRQIGDYDLTVRKVVEQLDSVRVPIPTGAYFTRGIGNHGAGQAVSEATIAELVQRLKAVKPGTVLQELGFGSTALGNKGSKFRNNEILFEFTAGEGVTAIPWFARRPEESEVIFPPGQRIAITDTPHFVNLRNGVNQLVVQAVLLPNA